MPAQPDFCPDRDRTASSQGGGDKTDGADGGKGVTLAAAKAAIERVLCRSGKEHWAPFEYSAAQGLEIKCLKRWAEANGAWLTQPEMVVWEDSPGTGEHRLKEVGDRMWKATKGGKFGIYLNCSGRAQADPILQIQKVKGTPYQYLTRLTLLNVWSKEIDGLQHLPELTRLEGVVVLDDEFSIITSQPCFVHDHEQPDADEIHQWLASMGFQSVTAGIYYRASDNLLLFDVKPANAIRSGGVIVPVDVIPMRPDGVLLSVVREVLGIR